MSTSSGNRTSQESEEFVRGLADLLVFPLERSRSIEVLKRKDGTGLALRFHGLVSEGGDLPQPVVLGWDEPIVRPLHHRRQ